MSKWDALGLLAVTLMICAVASCQGFTEYAHSRYGYGIYPCEKPHGPDR